MTSTQVHVRAAVRGGSNWGVPPDYRTSDERLEDHHSEGDTQLSEAETALRALLQSIGAEAAFEPLRREHVDAEALALMGEGDLREAGVALGPRKKLLNAGVCTRAHAGAPGQECREGGADWDLESESQVHELQRIAPVLVLHLKSGRVHSTNGDVAGILVHEEDVAFVILMRKEEGSFCMATRRGLPCAVSAVAASCTPSFSSYLTAAQRSVLDQVVRRIWQEAAASGANWGESDDEPAGSHVLERRKRGKATFDLPSNSLSASSSSDGDGDANDFGGEEQKLATESPAARAGAHVQSAVPSHSAAEQSQQLSRSRVAMHQGPRSPSASPTRSALELATDDAGTGGGKSHPFQHAGVATASGREGGDKAAESLPRESRAVSPVDMASDTQARSEWDAREASVGFKFDAFPRIEGMGGRLIKRVLQTSPLIVVLDGVGSASLHRAVCDAFSEPNMWSWGHTSLGTVTGARNEAPFWKCSQDTLEGCKAVQALSDLVVRLASQVIGRAVEIQRLYANGHTCGQGGSMHVDEHGTENYAAIYYANVDWRPEWMGHTHYLPGTLRDLRGQAGEHFIRFDALV